MIKGAKRYLAGFAKKLLDIDDTVRPVEHLKLFESYLDRNNFDTDTKDAVEFLKVMKKKHLIDDIVVSSMNGSSIASANGHGVTTAVSAAALFNYVASEHPKSESVLVKANGAWNMIFPLNRKLYIIKAASDISMVELRALAREVDRFLSSKQAN